MRRLTPGDLPAGVTTTATPLPNGGRIYTFTHAQLGDLGRLRITPHGPAQTLASAEIAPGDPDAPEWEMKYLLLDQVITTCLNVLPGAGSNKPLLGLEEMREQRRRFHRLVEAEHSIAMFGLAKELSERDGEGRAGSTGDRRATRCYRLAATPSRITNLLGRFKGEAHRRGELKRVSS